MRRAEVIRTLRGFRYKPGWSVRLDESGDVEVTARVPDAYHPGRRVETHAYVVDPLARGWGRRELMRRVADAIWRLEHHEFGEWLRYRGRRPFDPHRRTP